MDFDNKPKFDKEVMELYDTLLLYAPEMPVSKLNEMLKKHQDRINKTERGYVAATICLDLMGYKDPEHEFDLYIAEKIKKADDLTIKGISIATGMYASIGPFTGTPDKKDIKCLINKHSVLHKYSDCVSLRHKMTENLRQKERDDFEKRRGKI